MNIIFVDNFILSIYKIRCWLKLKKKKKPQQNWTIVNEITYPQNSHFFKISKIDATKS